MHSPPAFGRSFPVHESDTVSLGDLPGYEPSPSPPRTEARTKLFGAGGPPPGPGGAPAIPPPPISSPPSSSPGLPPLPTGSLSPLPSFDATSHSVSIVMPAPDGSMMAPLSAGPADFVIVRHGKRHGPYDLAQLERLIPMGKLRSIDTIEIQSSTMKILAVDVPGLRPLFEAKARAEEASVVRAMPSPPTASASPVVVVAGRGRLWAVIGLLALGLVAAFVYLASK